MYVCFSNNFLMEENIWVYVCSSTILMIENILGRFVSLNNLDDVKLLGMFVCQQF